MIKKHFELVIILWAIGSSLIAYGLFSIYGMPPTLIFMGISLSTPMILTLVRDEKRLV